MFRTIAILAMLFPLFAGCAATPPSRPGAQEMLHDLRYQQLGASCFEEYLSFTRIIDTAETQLKNGHYDEAEALYRLALVKGHILKLQAQERVAVPASAGAAVPASANEPAPPPAAGAALDPTDDAAPVKPPRVNDSLRPAAAWSPGKTGAPAEQQENRPRLLSGRIV